MAIKTMIRRASDAAPVASATGSTRGALWPSLVMALSIGIAPALAQAPAAGDLEGRWHDGRRQVTYDIKRCDKGWCGAIVQAGTCGRVVLRLTSDQAPAPAFTGQLESVDAATRTPVRGFVRNGALVLEDSSSPNRTMMTRRLSPEIMTLSRTGPAVCAVPGPVS